MCIKIKDNLENKNMWFNILNQWILNNKKYAEELNYEDVIYWHNEMANNSCLISAIWQIGGVATSEYSIDKKTTKNGGMADIFFKLNDVSYIIESKFTRDINNIEVYMKNAIEDCKDSYEEDIKNKMAIVFVSPINKKKEPKYQDYDIKVKLVISDKKEVEYKNKVYNIVYLFGKYIKDTTSRSNKNMFPRSGNIQPSRIKEINDRS